MYRAFRKSQGHSRGNRECRRFRDGPYVKESPDGNSLVYSYLGIENLDDQSIVENFSQSIKVIGEYSEDADKAFVNDRSSLSFLLPKYLPDPESQEKLVHMDLNCSINDIQDYSGLGTQGFFNLLTWIINNKDLYQQEISEQKSTDGGNFIMMRNLFGSLTKLPYNYAKDLKIYATSSGGVIYLIKDTAEDEKLDDGQPVRLWAHKLENYMTKEDSNAQVNCNEDFRAVLSANLGPHKLLYSAATDCANPEEFDEEISDLSAFIALKCCFDQPMKVPPSRFRELNYYMHCLLTGVPKVLVGYRDAEGLVSRLKYFDLPELLWKGKESWNPINSFFFTSRLLSFIKTKVEASPGGIFRFTKETRKAEVVCTEVEDEKQFLPRWFTKEIEEVNNLSQLH